MMLQFNENNVSVTYYLTAQMEPCNENDYAKPIESKMSKLRTDYALYLYEPSNANEEQKLGNPAGSISNLKQTLTSKVGGIGGLGSS